MNPGQAALALRKQRLVSRIAAQRTQVEAEVGALGDLPFAGARGVGEFLRGHAMPALVLVAGAGYLLTRGGLYAGALRAVRLAKRTARWWMLARLGWQYLRRSRSGERRLDAATR